MHAKFGYVERMFKRISHSMTDTLTTRASARLTAGIALAGGLIYLGACGTRSVPYQGMTAADIYSQARQDLEEEDYGDAADALDRILLTFPEFEQAAEVSLLLADTYYQDERYLTAASQYSRFISRYPNHPEAPRASLGMCRAYVELSPISQRDQTPTRQALTACRTVAQSLFGTPQADTAAVLAGEMIRKLAKAQYERSQHYLRIGNYDSAILYFEGLVAEFPDTEYAPKALLRIVEANRRIAEDSPGLGYENEAELARERLLTEYPLSPEAEVVRQRMRGVTPRDTTAAAAGRGSEAARSAPGG